MDLTPKISTPVWSIFYCCTQASSKYINDDVDDGYGGFLWSAPSINVVTLGGSKDFFAGQAAAETPTTACSDDTDDCYSFNVQCSSPPSKTTAAVVQQSDDDDVPQTAPEKTCSCVPSESSSDPSTPFIGIVEIITPKSRKQLKEGYEIKRTAKFNTTEEGSVTSEVDDDDISDEQDELMHSYNIDQDSFDENKSPMKYDSSNAESEINNVIELPIDAMPKLGLLHYCNRSAFSDHTNKGDANEVETSDEDEFYDSLESLGDTDSDDDCSTNNTQQISSPLIISSSNRKHEFRTMTTRELQFADMSFEVIPSLKKG